MGLKIEAALDVQRAGWAASDLSNQNIAMAAVTLDVQIYHNIDNNNNNNNNNKTDNKYVLRKAEDKEDKFAILV